MLSNLAVFAMDNKLQALADRYGLIYTRYSDDLIFSAGDLDRRRAAAVLINVRRIFSGFGFRLHRKKVTVAPPGARKVVLGLLVDGDRLRLSSEMRRRLRDHIRGAEKFGLVAHVEHRHFGSVWGFVRHVEGLLAYAQSVDAAFAVPLAQRFRAALAGEGWSP
jgi:RNA-directed DNA polymerase